MTCDVCPECGAVSHGNLFCGTCRRVNNERYGWDLSPWDRPAEKPCGVAEIEAFARRLGPAEGEE